MPILEIWSTEEELAVDYILHGYGDIEHYNDPDDDKLKSEGGNDEIHRFSDGSYVLIGHTGNTYGDSYKVSEKPYAFTTISGESEYRVVYEGKEITSEVESFDPQADTVPDWIDVQGLLDWTDRFIQEPTEPKPEPEPEEPEGEPEWLSEVAYFETEPQNPVTESDADFSVTDTSGFLNALQSVNEGDVIWVPGDAVIDLSGKSGLSVGADNVTIASNRNIPQEERGGALICTDHPGNVFKTRRNSLRVTGLYIEGPIPDTFIQDYDSDKSASFGLFYGEDCEFDNNEFTGWPFAGLALGAKSYPVSHEVHHNDFHDNLMQGLGYGLELYNGHHSLHHNYFNRNRHDISSFGRAENGYEAYHNVSGPEPYYHAFDMHALAENINHDTDLAGGRIHIHDNLFMFTHSFTDHPQEAVKIRGVPDEHCMVERNHFYHETEPSPPGKSGDAYYQQRVDTWTNFTAQDNEFGSDLAVVPPAFSRSTPYTRPDPMMLSGEFSVRSTPRTPAMRYRFEVDGEVREGASLESADSITDGEPTVVEGTVGPKGTDTYNINGEVTDWSAVRVENDQSVSPTAYEITHMGEPISLWELLGKEQPEHSDTGPLAIGGGEHYSHKVTREDADILVADSNLDSVISALNNSSMGDLVFISGNAEIYSPDEDNRVHVPAGVTLASNRGVDGNDGALFHTDAAYSYGAQGLITLERGARVTGIRTRGPHPDPNGGWRPHSYDYEMSGIEALGKDVEVDNCEVWGFAHLINGHTNTHCHHNHLHHANMQELGYCMSTGGSEGALFEFNYCNHWRHVVAASGGGGYEARDNLIDPPGLAHCFDQHSPGGTYTKLHHNTYRVHTGDDVASGDPRAPFATFRGSEVQNAEVYKNWSYNEWEPRDYPSEYFTDEFITKPKHDGTGWEGVEWWDNHLGTDEPQSDDIGCPR